MIVDTGDELHPVAGEQAVPLEHGLHLLKVRNTGIGRVEGRPARQILSPVLLLDEVQARYGPVVSWASEL